MVYTPAFTHPAPGQMIRERNVSVDYQSLQIEPFNECLCLVYQPGDFIDRNIDIYNYRVITYFHVRSLNMSGT